MNCPHSLGRWDRGFESHSRHGCLICVYVYSVCVGLCLGIGLATGWSLTQGGLPSVKMNSELNKRPGPWMDWKSHWKNNSLSRLDFVAAGNVETILKFSRSAANTNEISGEVTGRQEGGLLSRSLEIGHTCLCHILIMQIWNANFLYDPSFGEHLLLYSSESFCHPVCNPKT
jgi:hypothetical protein